MPGSSGRHVVGAAAVDPIRFLKNYERTHDTSLPLGPKAREVLSRRVLPAEWLSLEPFLEILSHIDRILLRGDEQRALKMGASGGASMRGLQKAYCVPGDPKSSVIAMRHAWRTHYDFGRLDYDATAPNAVGVTVEDYLDMPMVHGMLIAGWGLAAAQAGGSSDSTVRVLERPWQGAATFRFVIEY